MGKVLPFPKKEETPESNHPLDDVWKAVGESTEVMRQLNREVQEHTPSLTTPPRQEFWDLLFKRFDADARVRTELLEVTRRM